MCSKVNEINLAATEERLACVWCRYLSTNDIVTSWIFNMIGMPVGEHADKATSPLFDTLFIFAFPSR